MKGFDYFLRHQVAGAFYIVDDAQLRTVMLNEKTGDFMYIIEDECEYIYLKGYAKVGDMNRILNVIADVYGTNNRTYEYWLSKSRELKNECHD